jgi:integrase
MGRPITWPPRVRTHAASGLAFFRHRKRDYYLGPPGSAAADRRYTQLLAELGPTRGLPTIRPVAPDLTVPELTAWWGQWSAGNYPPTSDAGLRGSMALKPLATLFPGLPARQVRPKRLREYLAYVTAELGWCRTHANRMLVRVKTAFKRAAEEELIPGQVYQDLRCVQALPPGAPGVRETEPVGAADPDALAAILPFCPAPVAGMLELQSLTGMRSKEVRLLRPCDIDRSGDVWVYRPRGGGKAARRGHKRAVALGPRAQALLAPWLLRCPADDACVFPPSAAPKTAGRPRVGACYTEASYPRAVARAAKRAGVTGFRCYGTRHAFRNHVLRLGGVAGALAALGQKSTRALDEYGGGHDLELAKEIARKIG